MIETSHMAPSIVLALKLAHALDVNFETIFSLGRAGTSDLD